MVLVPVGRLADVNGTAKKDEYTPGLVLQIVVPPMVVFKRANVVSPPPECPVELSQYT